jgi:chemotaxis protein methyltransferase CheR
MTGSAALHPGDDYEALCAAVRRLAGIDLLQYKRAQMERRIRSFAISRGAEDLDAYSALLGREAAELAALLDRVTINVSQLWRHPDQWDTLATHVLPQLAETGRVRAWSAGCSYGAEAYTLAAACRDVTPGAALSILGTDIDRRAIERARRGVFTVEDARDAPPAALGAHFEFREGAWHARPELHEAVRFQVADLLRMPTPRGVFDLVVCRNTVIYFNEDVRDALHGRLADALRPGGHLLVGATERVSEPARHRLESVLPFVYRRAA